MAESAPKKIKTNDDATDKLQVDDGDSKPSAIPHDEFIHDGCLRIPKVDCTNESYFKYNSILTVRELICWALRTETKVRLAKIERRSGLTTNDDPEYSYSKTLNSNYLIDVYPENQDEKKMKSDLTKDARDVYKFSRKASCVKRISLIIMLIMNVKTLMVSKLFRLHCYTLKSS